MMFLGLGFMGSYLPRENVTEVETKKKKVVTYQGCSVKVRLT